MSDGLGPSYREPARYNDALHEAAGKSYAAEVQAVLDLGRRFDVVTCLLSAIGHGADERDLDDGVAARVSRSHLDGDALVLDVAWAVTTDTAVATHEAHYRMPLWTRERYLEAVERAGLSKQWHDHVPGFSADRGMLTGSRAG